MRRRFRYSIRALLVAMTLLALFLGYHLHWIGQRRAMIASGAVTPFPIVGIKQPRAPGMLALFGEPGYGAISAMKNVNAKSRRSPYVVEMRESLDSDETSSRARQLFPEALFLVSMFDFEPPQPSGPPRTADEDPQVLHGLPQLPLATD
jgi:hypothetical protein